MHRRPSLYDWALEHFYRYHYHPSHYHNGDNKRCCPGHSWTMATAKTFMSLGLDWGSTGAWRCSKFIKQIAGEILWWLCRDDSTINIIPALLLLLDLSIYLICLSISLTFIKMLWPAPIALDRRNHRGLGAGCLFPPALQPLPLFYNLSVFGQLAYALRVAVNVCRYLLSGSTAMSVTAAVSVTATSPSCHTRLLLLSLTLQELRETRSSAVAKRPRALRVIEYFAKSLKVIRNDTVE